MIVKDDVLSKNIILIFRVIFKIFNKMEDVRCVVMLDFQMYKYFVYSILL